MKVRPDRRSLCLLLLLLASAAVTAAPPKVVASIKPLHSLVANVMDGVAEPGLLLDSTSSPHQFSLKPSDMRLLQSADLVIWVGRELERPLLKILGVSGKPSAQIELLRQPQVAAGQRVREVEAVPADGHHHADDHGHHAGHDHAAGMDPHIWLSPGMAGVIVELLMNELSQRDPDNAVRYRANAEKTLQRLQQLDVQLAARLAPLQDRTFLVYHDGYGWFQAHYGLKSAVVIALNPQRQPGAATVRRLSQQARQRDAQCIFTEPQFSPKLAERLASDLGLRHGVLDPLGTGLVAGPEAYFQLLNNLADSLSRCLNP